MAASARARHRRPVLDARFRETGLLHVGTTYLHYTAFDTRLCRPVVVKIAVDPHRAWASAALVREAALTRRLRGEPHVVALLDEFALTDGAPALVFERCAASLADPGWRIHRTPRRIVSIGIRLCGALEALHRTGFAHADLRPSNVFVTSAGEIRLGGFDEASTLDAALPDHPLHAPRPQTAPELLEGAVPSEATDVYGLGVTLYELLAGRPAFRAYDAGRPSELGLRILRGTRAPMPPTVPLALADLLDWAMAVDPVERPPSPAWLAEELRHMQFAPRPR